MHGNAYQKEKSLNANLQYSDENFKQKLKRNILAAWNRRKIYIVSKKIEAFRLATRDELQIPVAIDIYGSLHTVTGDNFKLIGRNAVLQIYEQSVSDKTLRILRELLISEFSLAGFYEKKRYRIKKNLDTCGSPNDPPMEIIINEYGHRFLINLNNYLDCGLFSDHRETRLRVENSIRNFGKKVIMLNLFAYTGSFSVYAAAGGAIATHSVDMSKTYCDWARRNFDLNAMPSEKHWIYRMDVFEFFRYAARKKLIFDFIVIDPPTFSRSEAGNFSVQKDHARLIQEAAKFLRNDGTIIFSNNCLNFRIDKTICSDFDVRDIQNETIPPDFWLNTISRNWWANQRNKIHNCYLIKKNIESQS